MNKKLIEKLSKKEHIRRENEVETDVLKECLPYQLTFIKDPSKRKSVCGTRRAAKSFMFALYLIDQAIRVPKSKCLYMGLTNESCKQIMYTDILQVVFDKYHIDAKCTSKYEIDFDNGSVIFLRGLDATPHQMNRLRGNKFDIGVMDELQDFTQDIEQIINGVLKMSLAQTDATLCIGGTPGNKQGDHYFWRVCKPDTDLTEWKNFFFDWRENTSIEPKTGKRVCDAIKESIDKDIARDPAIVHTPKFQQEVMGKWVIDTDARVYKSSEKNYISEDVIKHWFYKNCTYILSIDLGYIDATAYCIGAYSKTYDRNLYILESFKKTEQTITDVANEIKSLMKSYKFQSIIIDSANLQAVEEMRQIHSLPLTAAQKAGKEAHIALINSDFITDNIKIIKEENKELILELETLIWDQKAILTGKYKEDAKKENHLCDSILYLHNASRHYWFNAEVPPLSYEDAVVDEIEKQFLKKSQIRTINSWIREEDI